MIGCNENEHRGSLVKIKTEVDEPLFYRRSQNHKLRIRERFMTLSGISDDTVRKKV